jgi:hypothetical protein
LRKNVVTLYRRCRPVPPQVGHCLWAQVDIAPKRRPVPLQVRHLRNGVSQIDTSHMTKPTTAVIIAPVPASCVCAALPKNTAANIKTHPMSVMIPCAAEECNRQSGASLASPGAQADVPCQDETTGKPPAFTEHGRRGLTFERSLVPDVRLSKVEHSGVLDARSGSVEQHLPAVFRNEGDHEKISGPLAAITLALGTIVLSSWPDHGVGGRRRPLSYGNTAFHSVHSGVGSELRFRWPVQPAVAGSHGFPARARVMASRAVRLWFAVESR